MAERRFAVCLPPIVAGLLLTAGLAAGCSDTESRHTGAQNSPEGREFFLNDEPLPPAGAGRSEERDEERDPGGY